MIVIFNYGGGDFTTHEVKSKQEAIDMLIESAQEYADDNYDEPLQILIDNKNIKGIAKYLYSNYHCNSYTEPRNIF
jgi:hypothetical protein